MNKNDAFPGNYIKAEDLKGGPVTLQVASVTMQVVDEKQDKSKPVMQFSGTEKSFVINITNWNNIEMFLGQETSQWVGHKIQLYPTTTEFGGKTVPCIRVRQPPMATTALPPMAQSIDPINPTLPVPSDPFGSTLGEGQADDPFGM